MSKPISDEVRALLTPGVLKNVIDYENHKKQEEEGRQKIQKRRAQVVQLTRGQLEDIRRDFTQVLNVLVSSAETISGFWISMDNDVGEILGRLQEKRNNAEARLNTIRALIDGIDDE